MLGKDAPECLDRAAEVLRGERVDGVLHRIRGDDQAVVTVRVRPLEVTFEGNCHGQVADLMAIRAADHLDQAAQTLQGLGSGAPTADQETRLIRVPVGSEGPTVLLETVRRLDDAGIAIEDIALHRPTLDDVFLSLTGHAAEMALAEEEESEPEPKKRGKRRDR